MYAAISIAWDKLKSEGEVDIFRAVKTIKMNRPDLVENLVGILYGLFFSFLHHAIYFPKLIHLESTLNWERKYCAAI